MDTKDLIYTKRKEKGLTTTELGKLVGVSHATISRWEKGNIAIMKSNHIAKLANALGVSPIDLLKDDKPVVTEVEYHRTNDIGLRISYFIEELALRPESFTLDGVELDKEDVATIISLVESNLEVAKKLVHARHK